jgi:hypothetical protein
MMKTNWVNLKKALDFPAVQEDRYKVSSVPQWSSRDRSYTRCPEFKEKGRSPTFSAGEVLCFSIRFSCTRHSTTGIRSAASCIYIFIALFLPDLSHVILSLPSDSHRVNDEIRPPPSLLALYMTISASRTKSPIFILFSGNISSSPMLKVTAP